MTRNVVTADEDMPLNQIAELLERRHIKRVPVVKAGRLTGIVSRANLLHGLASTIIAHHEPGAARDRHLRDELVKILLDKHKLDTVLVNVTVNDGNVRLWGVVEMPNRPPWPRAPQNAGRRKVRSRTISTSARCRVCRCKLISFG